MQRERIRRKYHHLPRDCYIGAICVGITARIDNGSPIFTKTAIVATFTEILRGCVAQSDCQIPVYCFMPEHIHILIQGSKESSDTWTVVTGFKQRTGYWLSKHSHQRWQKDFYDRILRHDVGFAKQVRYIVNNPVRRGLVKNWEDYPYTGSIGFDLKELLSEL